MLNLKMEYFQNKDLLQNILLPYFCYKHPLKLLNKQFSKLDYEKYNTHIQPHGILETYYKDTKSINTQKTYKNSQLNGLYACWYENGNIEIRCNFNNEKKMVYMNDGMTMESIK